jgi:hypothetical protein
MLDEVPTEMEDMVESKIALGLIPGNEFVLRVQNRIMPNQLRVDIILRMTS